MPEATLPLSWRQAALLLEARLREVTEQVPERLDARAIDSCYPHRQYAAGWRVGVTFTDGIMRRIDVVATVGFPSTPIRTALVDHPPFMTWPHVERDDILCLLPNMAECDPDDPCTVAENLLNRSIRLVEELLEGTIVERDFREEFLTYWAYKSHQDDSYLFSLLTPTPPSRVVQIWREKRSCDRWRRQGNPGPMGASPFRCQGQCNNRRCGLHMAAQATAPDRLSRNIFRVACISSRCRPGCSCGA